MQTPDCSDLQLEAVEPLVSMFIDFGSGQEVSQGVPQITDSFGLLSMDFCQLSFAVVLDLTNESVGRLLQSDPTATLPPPGGAAVGFLNASEQQILL